jgi:hypothetical protein
VTISPDYLKGLSTGSHTVTLIYPDGSAKAKFSIKAQDRVVPPAVTAQPRSMEVAEGGSVTFTVTASGSTPLVCQWQVDKGDGVWTDIPGAVNASYTVQNAASEQNGWKYRCVVTNDAGSAESNGAALTVKTELGTVPATNEEEPAETKKSGLRKIVLPLVLLAAAGGLGGGLYYYFRRRSRYMDE